MCFILAIAGVDEKDIEYSVTVISLLYFVGCSNSVTKYNQLTSINTSQLLPPGGFE
jgi:hypothetical protein